MSALFDPGLQPERTLLAWRRTLLAIGVGGLIGLRLVPVVLGPWSLPLPLAVLAGAVVLHLLSERRFRATYAALTAQRPLPSPARLTFAVAAVVALTAAGAIVCVLALGIA